jgi:hypothetical protein
MNHWNEGIRHFIEYPVQDTISNWFDFIGGIPTERELIVVIGNGCGTEEYSGVVG